MNTRMRRMLLFTILLVSLSETLILHWAAIAFRGTGFGFPTGTLIRLTFANGFSAAVSSVFM